MVRNPALRIHDPDSIAGSRERKEAGHDGYDGLPCPELFHDAFSRGFEGGGELGGVFAAGLGHVGMAPAAAGVGMLTLGYAMKNSYSGRDSVLVALAKDFP